MPPAKRSLRSQDLDHLDEDLYLSQPDSIAWRLNDLDGELYGREPDEAQVLLPTEIMDYWIEWGRARIRRGQDIIVVIDADRRATGSPTRIGKSTLGMTLLSRWDPTFKAAVIRERYASSPSDLARFDLKCQPGQGILYDEGMWGGRGRDAMSPENKLLGEILGTLASRQAIVAICSHSMLSLDPDVKALASLRFLVRRPGLAEVHVPTVHFDLEKPRLLPFRQHEMSPILWDKLTGTLMETYETVKRDAQDRRIEVKLHEQAIFEARRLGLGPKEALEYVSAGGSEGNARPPAPQYEPDTETRCGRCRRTFDNAHNLETHIWAAHGGPAQG